MSFWPKSRYTASLEEQVRDLKADKERLEKQVESLTTSNHEFMRTLLITPPMHGKVGTDKNDVPLPKAVNWLRARGLCESTDLRITEGEPDKEKSANGSR